MSSRIFGQRSSSTSRVEPGSALKHPSLQVTTSQLRRSVILLFGGVVACAIIGALSYLAFRYANNTGMFLFDFIIMFRTTGVTALAVFAVVTFVCGVLNASDITSFVDQGLSRKSIFKGTCMSGLVLAIGIALLMVSVYGVMGLIASSVPAAVETPAYGSYGYAIHQGFFVFALAYAFGWLVGFVFNTSGNLLRILAAAIVLLLSFEVLLLWDPGSQTNWLPGLIMRTNPTMTHWQSFTLWCYPTRYVFQLNGESGMISLNPTYYALAIASAVSVIVLAILFTLIRLKSRKLTVRP